MVNKQAAKEVTLSELLELCKKQKGEFVITVEWEEEKNGGET